MTANDSTVSPPARLLRSRALALLCACTLAACGSPPAEAPERPDPLVTGPDRQPVDSLRVDVLADATVSMAGYTTRGQSAYITFLEGIEGAIQGAWRRADVRYFRFGDTTRELRREAFLGARSPAFYSERTTGIDRVINCQRPGRVSLVLTDLFQSDGDVNAIVGQIKDRCFQRGISAAILGVKSAFDGTVFDARVPAYRYASGADTASYRPFYALLFGEGPELEFLLSSIADQTGFGHDFVVIAPHVVRRYDVTMRKAPQSRELNAQRHTPYHFRFAMRKGEQQATMLAEVVITPAAGTPPVRAEQLELTAYRRGAGGDTDSIPSRDITLESVTQSGDTLHATLRLALTDPPGTYQYRLVLRTGAIGGFGAPPWIDRYSSTNPTPTVDANRTLNLAKFVLDLRRASSSVSRPSVAAWSVTIRKL